MEKYKALAEYNELAFVDLEERLSAVREGERPEHMIILTLHSTTR